MIRSSFVLKGIALAAALGAHSFAAVSFNDQPDIQIESDAGGQVAALGNSFADMSAGTLAPDTPEDLQSSELPEPTPTKETVEKTEPEKATETMATADLAEVIEPQLTPTTVPTPASLAQQAVGAIPVLQATTPSQQARKPLEAIKPISAQKPHEPVKTETLAATIDPNTTAVTRSQRPKVRTQELEKRAALAKPKPKAKKKPKAKAGNGKRNAKAGSASGTCTAKAKKQGNGKAAKKQSGNAAASNYPGRVMARISSVGRPRVNARGTAVIRFTISSNGGLNAAGVSKSSGSRRLDTAALNIIQRASPFPKPPAGARRTYSINIAGR